MAAVSVRVTTMLIENTSDLIRQVEHRILPSGIAVDIATLINDTALVLASDSLSLYRTAAQAGDPLGNGLIASVALPVSLPLQSGRFLQEHRAGYVGLSGGYVLLITLNDTQLFASKEDALRNRNELARLSLAH